MGKDSELLHAVKVEDVTMVQKIASKLNSKSKKSGSKKSPLNFQDEDGFSALHHAALNGNTAILAALLDTQYIAVDIRDNKDMRPLHYAAWQGKVEPVSVLLRSGADPNCTALDGETPLHLASQYGSFRVVEILLQYRANPAMTNKADKTPLDLAAEFGKLKVVEHLVESNLCRALLESPADHSLDTPLHLAAKNGHSDVIRVLLVAGMHINSETPNGTSLHAAALGGKSEVVRLLITSGINVHKKNSHGQTALDIVNKFTPTRAASDIKQMLRDAIGGCQARAIRDFIKIHDRSALSFKAGEIITILQKSPDGRWKGLITKAPNMECIGYFPANCVQILDRPVSTNSLIHPNVYGHGPPTPTGQHPTSPTYITSTPHHYQPLSHHQQQQDQQQQQGSPTMPAGVYSTTTNLPLTSLAGDRTTNHRYSSDSSASASSSGNWSNRESFDQQQMQGSNYRQQGFYQPGSPTAGVPTHQLSQSSMNGGYGLHHDKAYPPAPHPETMHRAHTMDGTNGGPPHLMIPPGQRSSGGSPQHTPSSGSISPYGSGSPYQSGTPQSLSPRRVGISNDGVWVRKGHLDNSGEESGVDVNSSTESMERKGSGSVSVPRGTPTIHMNVNTQPLSHSQPCRSFENVLGDRQCVQPGPRRPHSDSSTEIKVDAIRPPNVRPHYQGKDVDRIYEWLKQHHLGEYTNNFTKAGYDFPTIARMTPEDLTAIGITKPGHRKRVSAMISQLSEPDGIPNVRPPDVPTWLKLLDLYGYYNTLITNGYNTMESVLQITWEDLQDIGITRLGHQKKFSLAIRRLQDLKKRARHHRNAASHSYQYDNSTGSDAGSVSPHSSVDGFPPPPPPTMLAIGETRPSPMQSPSPNEPPLTMVKPKTGLRSSQESLGSDISNKSSGSLGSRGSKGSRGESYGHRQILHPMRSVDHSDASYVPLVTNLKVSPDEKQLSKLTTPVQEKLTNSSSENVSFSTFKKPPSGHRPSVLTPSGKPPTGQLGESPTAHSSQYSTFQDGKLPSQKSSESLDRLLEECTSHMQMQKRNSIDSTGSSGSGDQNVKLKRTQPPPPPKRSNSVITTRSDEHMKTATIGRKKSMKQFREEMKLVRQDMQAAIAAAPPQAPSPQSPGVKSSDIPEGYATIKRSPSRKASHVGFQLSNSNEEGNAVPRRPNSGGSIPTGHDLSPGELDQLRQSAARPLNLGNFGPAANSDQNMPSVSTPSTFSQASKPVVPNKPSVSNKPSVPNKPSPAGGIILNMPPTRHAHHAQVPQQLSLRQIPSQQKPLHISPKPTPTQHQPPPQLQPQIIQQQQQQQHHHISQISPSSNVQLFAMPSSQQTLASGGSNMESALQAPHPSYVAHRQDIPPSTGPFKMPDVPQPKVPRTSGNSYDRIEASLRESIRTRTPNFPSTSDTSSVGSGSTSVSNGSSDSGLPRTSKTDRPSSVEMILKRSSGGEDSSAPNPLEGIWKPRSRHFTTQNSEEIENVADATNDDGKPMVKANVTFRALKQQYLDGENAPKGLISGRRPARKSDLNVEEYQGRRSFTDADEHRQSPICKTAPVSFDDIMPDVQSGSTETTPVDSLPAAVKCAKPPVALPAKAQASAQDLPPPPAWDLPPLPPSQEFTPPSVAPDLPLPPPPMTTSVPFPPPPNSQALLPPPPVSNIQSVHAMPSSPQMKAPAALPTVPANMPRLPGMSSLPPPPVPSATYKKSPSKTRSPPQAPLKKKLHKQSVVSEGWDSSDTVKRKPVVTPSISLAKPAVKAASMTRSKPKVNKPKTLPHNKPSVIAPQSKEDVDIYSQDLDMMDSLADSDDVVDSDSSETMETGLSGFENENTDTIKKQPLRLSPTKTKEESAADSVEAQLEALKLTMDMGSGTNFDLGDTTLMNSSREKQRRASRDSLGEATSQLESLLSSMVDDPLASFAASAEAASSKSSTDACSFSLDEGRESKDLFSDIESMFNDLTEDLDNMIV